MSAPKSHRFSRRMLLGLLSGSAASATLAGAPEVSIRARARPPKLDPRPNPYAGIVEAAGLGGQTGYALADAKSGAFLAFGGPQILLPPASVTKALTAAYGLRRLGPSHRFQTALIGTGDVINGELEGDLILQGGGDPTLDTDALGDLASSLKEVGIFAVNGRFRIFSHALPLLPWIDSEQPDHVGYNPAISGLNLNFNRVHFPPIGDKPPASSRSASANLLMISPPEI